MDHASLDEHHDTIHLTDTAFADRRAMLEEVAKAQAAFTAYRDEMARLCEYWRVEIGPLEAMTSHAADLANDLLYEIRKEYGRS